MTRLTAIDPAQAEGKAKALLDGIQKTLGMTPNVLRTLANAPAALEAYLSFGQALSKGRLDAHLLADIGLDRGQIRFVVDGMTEAPARNAQEPEPVAPERCPDCGVAA